MELGSIDISKLEGLCDDLTTCSGFYTLENDFKKSCGGFVGNKEIEYTRMIFSYSLLTTSKYREPRFDFSLHVLVYLVLHFWGTTFVDRIPQILLKLADLQFETPKPQTQRLQTLPSKSFKALGVSSLCLALDLPTRY